MKFPMLLPYPITVSVTQHPAPARSSVSCQTTFIIPFQLAWITISYSPPSPVVITFGGANLVQRAPCIRILSKPKPTPVYSRIRISNVASSGDCTSVGAIPREDYTTLRYWKAKVIQCDGHNATRSRVPGDVWTFSHILTPFSDNTVRRNIRGSSGTGVRRRTSARRKCWKYCGSESNSCRKGRKWHSTSWANHLVMRN